MKTNGWLQCRQPKWLQKEFLKKLPHKTLAPILRTSVSKYYMLLARKKKTPSFLLHTASASAFLEQQLFKLMKDKLLCATREI